MNCVEISNAGPAVLLPVTRKKHGGFHVSEKKWAGSKEPARGWRIVSGRYFTGMNPASLTRAWPVSLRR